MSHLITTIKSVTHVRKNVKKNRTQGYLVFVLSAIFFTFLYKPPVDWIEERNPTCNTGIQEMLGFTCGSTQPTKQTKSTPIVPKTLHTLKHEKS